MVWPTCTTPGAPESRWCVVVGDHATYHKKYDAPLESDIDALAGSVSGWVHRTGDTADVAADAAEAITKTRCH